MSFFCNPQSQALIMLPFFTTLPSGPLEELQRALEALVAAHFPMQSDEFPRGSLQRNNYMDCVRKVNACKHRNVPEMISFMNTLMNSMIFFFLLNLQRCQRVRFSHKKKKTFFFSKQKNGRIF